MTDVLLLIRSLDLGGAERQFTMLALGLAAQNIRVTVATLYRGGAFERELHDGKVRVVHLQKRTRWGLLAPVFRFWRLLRQERPRVVYSFMPVANVLSSITRFALPSANLAWGIRASSVDFGDYSRFAALVSTLERLLSRAPRISVSNSERGRADAIARGFTATRIVVIPNGIDVEKFQFDAAGRQKLRLKWSLPADALVFGLVARFDPMKGHEDFIDAISHAEMRGVDAHYVCIGADISARRAQIRDRIAATGIAGRVRLVEPEVEMPAVFSALDVIVSASRYGEGFSNSIAEGMSCSRPCVATDVGDSAHIVTSESGWIASAGNRESLARAMRTSFDAGAQTRARFGENARRRIMENYSDRVCREKTVKALGL